MAQEGCCAASSSAREDEAGSLLQKQSAIRVGKSCAVLFF